ncbi:2-dehydropantoate 2-reductase N-terminal domain-containing protein [Hyphomicrobium sp. CS1BSMeth3]|uniref:2-dehydropantoate 2-reductase N-terminal domain-containing protein n=1 Tax=Hyphomicrobium sp. CS1BSMeth3 TaxID=1892844 RepID=UPI000931A23E|nr:2-dehydropantoate 2-reductase N-terminal domain-containing protein [Hyphomicrobium sp. CS1BSMeth3]
MKIGILGAGNVALANAAWLASKGHDIHLWTALDGERQALADGTLSIEGLINAKAKIKIASDVSSVIADAELVMIAAPAFAHDTLMSAASPVSHERSRRYGASGDGAQLVAALAHDGQA